MRKRFTSLPKWLLCAVALLAPDCFHARADDIRLRIDCKINGKHTNFILDTGASATFISRDAAERLGLKIKPRPKNAPVPPGEIPTDLTEECTVELHGDKPLMRTFQVADLDHMLVTQKIDGVISWRDLGDSALGIDAARSKFAPVPLPQDIARWTKWKMTPGEDLLIVERTDGGKTTRIGIDTGDPRGIRLTSEKWKEWRAGHTNLPVTVLSEWSPAGSDQDHEQCRAPKFEVGKLSIPDVPVTAEDSMDSLSYKGCDAVLGLFALTRLYLVIDYKDKTVYTTPAGGPAPNAATTASVRFFESSPDGPYASHVLKGGPAWEAGVRNGDVLLKINGSDKLPGRDGLYRCGNSVPARA